MPAFRSLPDRPSLEFERKRAKTLLREMRRTRPQAKLADAQRTVARDYGFAGWRALVRYFRDAERQDFARLSDDDPQRYEAEAKSLILQLQQRRGAAGRAFAAFLPRLYGRPLEEVYATSVTEEEARLVTARMHGSPSWRSLLERTAAFQREIQDGRSPKEIDPRMRRYGNASSVERLLARHPDQINTFLYGNMYMDPEAVRLLLDRGADPDWIAPNGTPVLEYALLRYWNGAAVDVLAERAKPRRALWIAAGLGDLEGVKRALDRNGRPTKEARRIRPDFISAGFEMAGHPDAGDEEILFEAFLVAAINGRTHVIDYLASRGFDVNSMPYDQPLLNVAVGNGWVPVVESLLRCGADPDLRGFHPDSSAREIARELYEQQSDNPSRRRIVELIGKA